MSQWYYAQNDEQIGPVTGTALKELASEGVLHRDDLIWKEGMQRWAPAHKVRGLFPEVTTNDARQKQIQPSSDGEAPRQQVDDDRFKAYSEPDQASDDGGSQGDASVDEAAPMDDTAFDELPLVSPEESRLHVPTLGTPDGTDDKPPSSEAVDFEPIAPPPSSLDNAPPPAAGGDQPAATKGDSTDHTRRVDTGPKRVAMPLGLIFQTFLWTNCLVVVLLGGPLVCGLLLLTEGLQRRLFISSCYLMAVAMTYVLARTVERMTRLADRHWGKKRSRTSKRRSAAARNRQRFQ